MTDEYFPMPQNPKRKFSGEYIGVVETGLHDKYMRVQVRVKEIFTDEAPAASLPWATYRLPTGSRVNDGAIIPVKAGDYVWVDFPFASDTRRPRITGSVHYCPGETTHLPDETWAGPNKCTPLRTGIEAEVDEDRGTNPPCAFKQNGVCAEILADGTIRVTNIASGSNIELSPDGAVTIHAEKSLYLSTKENVETAVHGDHDLTVMGDIIQSGQNDVTETALGQRSISATKSISITSDSKITIKAPAVEIN